MANRRKRGKKLSPVQIATKLGMGAGGGLVGNMITTEYEKNLIEKGKNPANAPLLTAALSYAGAMFLPPDFIDVAVGMAAVSGAELAGNMINKNINPPPTSTTTGTATTSPTSSQIQAAKTRIQAAKMRIQVPYAGM